MRASAFGVKESTDKDVTKMSLDFLDDNFGDQFCRNEDGEGGVCGSSLMCKVSGGKGSETKGCGNFKVCCVNNFSCGSGEVDLKRFTFSNPNYPNFDGGNQICTLKMKIRDDTCAIRIKFLDFLTVRLVRSLCDLDKFIILGFTRGPMEEICGNQTGHSSTMLVHKALTDRFTFTHILQSTKYKWKIEVTQISKCMKTPKESKSCGMMLITPKVINGTTSHPKLIKKNRVKRKVVDIPQDYHILPDFVTTNLISKLWGRATFQTLQDDTKLASRIIKGEDSVQNEFPWMASLKIKPNTFFCGGALINEYFILTAAHCVQKASPEVILVELGRIKLFDKSSIRRNVREVIYHWNYLSSRLWYDIALLRLDQKVQLSPSTVPVCLPSMGSIQPGTIMTTSGWGVVNPVLYLIATTLQKGKMKILSHEECKKKWGRFGVQINVDMLCVSSSTVPISCNGDSGSPGVVVRSDGKYEIAGIVSFGALGCFRPDLDVAVIYTKAHSYLQWLAVNLQDIEEV